MNDKYSRDEEKSRVITKIKELMDYLEPQLDKFPRSEKSYAGIATKMRMCMNAMAEACVGAEMSWYAKSVLKELFELDKQIQYTKFYAERCKSKKYFEFRRFEIVMNFLEEIGKMTGAWIKKIQDAEKSKTEKPKT